MRIAQVAPVRAQAGGIGRIAEEYAKRLRRNGHEVVSFFPHVRMGNAGLFFPWVLRGFDVIHLHYPFYGGAEPIAWCRRFFSAAGLVVTYHMDAQAGGWRGKFFSWHRRLAQNGILAAADRILISSMDYARHSALADFSQQEKIVEMPFGVDTEFFHLPNPAQKQKARGSFGVLGKDPVFLFVGHLDRPHAFKGLSVLFSALDRLTDFPWRLLVVGDGPLRSVYEAEAQKRPWSRQVIFSGFVREDELSVAYQAADIHVFPSISFAEAYGLVVLEAAASGIPTVASNLPGVRTLVVDGQTGLLIQAAISDLLAEALKRLLENPLERGAMGQAARSRVQRHYAWPELIWRLEEVYKRVTLESKKRKAT